MAEMIIEAITTNVLDIVLAVISIAVSVYLLPLIRTELKPWLEEKRIYSLTQKFVMAVEKMAETEVIPKVDKKQIVINLLRQNGIEVTPTVESFIESCVKELDLVESTIVEEIKGEEGQ